MTKTLVFGATSAIAQATARQFAADGDTLFLVARNGQRLAAVADDLRTRGAVRVETMVVNATEYDRHESLVRKAAERMDGLDLALIAHGSLPDQKACEASFELTRRELETNLLSVISLATHLANHFERQGRGTIAVLSSVAGDRGRQSNYIYGAAKGAVTLFLQGLRNRLAKSSVHVVTIKPGFVNTPMTADFPKGVLWAQPEQVGKKIYRAVHKGQDVVYVPRFWHLIMLIIRAIPESVFKRLSL